VARFKPLSAMGVWLSEEEQIILRYLQNCGENGASAREIARKAWTKDAWKENERWSYRPLSSLKDKNMVLTTPAGNYRLRPPPEEEKEQQKKKPTPLG
jgi:hypothetical protein